jgi:S1-C subfamily serine protease
MRENRFFVRSTDLRGHLAARIGEAPAILSYSSVIERVAALAGPEAASLFAEPVLPRGVSDPGTAISWYSTHEGVVLELDTIDEVARRPIAERLTQRLASLAPALADQEIGATLSAWLNITSPRDVLAVGGEPVLVNWGFLPTDHIPPLDQRRQEFARGLGRYAPQLALPPARVDAAQTAARGETAAAVGALDAGVGAPSPVRRRAGITEDDGPPPPPGGGNNDGTAPGGDSKRRPWLAPLVASALAAIALLLLLAPGVLVYPSVGNSTTSADFEADRLRTSTESLEQQLKALQDAARDRVCRSADLRIPVPRSDNEGGKQSPSPQMLVLPQTPERLPVPPNARTADDASVANVADLMEKATVLVIGLKPPDNFSEGSGFFISDRLIVTNHHVIAHVDPDFIFVASQALGGARHAKLITKTMPPPSETDLRPDLAVLEIEPANRPALKLGPSPVKLSAAYVAGYPFFLLSKDVQFVEFLKKLAQHHSDAELVQQRIRVPGADLRLGRINNVMSSGNDALPVVVHDMQLAQGNSGGPLVDACGRLSGVNTLLFPNDQGSQQGNVAQDVSVLNKFLTEQHIAFQTDETPCQPPVAASAPTPSQNPPQKPEARK